jgi:hypothetical protein
MCLAASFVISLICCKESRCCGISLTAHPLRRSLFTLTHSMGGIPSKGIHSLIEPLASITRIVQACSEIVSIAAAGSMNFIGISGFAVFAVRDELSGDDKPGDELRWSRGHAEAARGISSGPIPAGIGERFHGVVDLNPASSGWAHAEEYHGLEDRMKSHRSKIVTKPVS